AVASVRSRRLSTTFPPSAIAVPIVTDDVGAPGGSWPKRPDTSDTYDASPAFLAARTALERDDEYVNTRHGRSSCSTRISAPCPAGNVARQPATCDPSSRCTLHASAPRPSTRTTRSVV